MVDMPAAGWASADTHLHFDRPQVDDLNLAQRGDEGKVKAWYYDNSRPFGGNPGKALAQEVVVTLAKPLEHTGKKPRQSAVRPAPKSRLSK